MKRFSIERQTRPDGIHCFYFKVDGKTRHSSYDEYDIKNFALGYAGREIPITIIKEKPDA